MPRLQLTPRSGYPFCTGLAVRVTDLNYGGHLGNDRLLALLQEARVAFLADHGWSELDCAGAGLIMTDAAVQYRGEAFAGDRLDIEVALGDATRTGFRIFYRMTRRGDGAIIAVAETGMACFDYQRRRVAPLPGPVRALCEED
ncbi:MAG: thioesterase family protein [Candidatus Krumholzibacteriia bacterium]